MFLQRNKKKNPGNTDFRAKKKNNSGNAYSTNS